MFKLLPRRWFQPKVKPPPKKPLSFRTGQRPLQHGEFPTKTILKARGYAPVESFHSGPFIVEAYQMHTNPVEKNALSHVTMVYRGHLPLAAVIHSHDGTRTYMVHDQAGMNLRSTVSRAAKIVKPGFVSTENDTTPSRHEIRPLLIRELPYPHKLEFGFMKSDGRTVNGYTALGKPVMNHFLEPV
jgi:hypothetical protein